MRIVRNGLNDVESYANAREKVTVWRDEDQSDITRNDSYTLTHAQV